MQYQNILILPRGPNNGNVSPPGVPQSPVPRVFVNKYATRSQGYNLVDQLEMTSSGVIMVTALDSSWGLSTSSEFESHPGRVVLC